MPIVSLSSDADVELNGKKERQGSGVPSAECGSRVGCSF